MTPGPPPRHGLPVTLLGVLAGAAIGFGLSSALYLLLNPVLEDSRGWVRELQGPLWNVVPLFTVAGALLGWWVVRGRPRPP